VEALLEAAQASAPAQALRTSFYVYPLVSAAHVAAVGILLASVLVMHARAAGAFSGLDRIETQRHFRRLALGAFLFAAMTGAALFLVNATEYALNGAFRLKLVLLALAGLNLCAWLAWPRWRPAGAVVSALVWTATLVAGRFIGFL
jgi:hypothetical protein